MDFFSIDTCYDDIFPLFTLDNSPSDIPSFSYPTIVDKHSIQSCPDSPTIRSLDASVSDIVDVSFPVPFRPEESYDPFESINSQPLFFNDSSCFDMIPLPSLNEVSYDPFVSTDASSSLILSPKHSSILSCEQTSLKKSSKKIPETVKFVCHRSSCKRVSNKCGEFTSQLLLKRFQERKNHCREELRDNPYYCC